ncbi:MAG: MBL fold metallo-hydrolase [candidate division WOR-3 bacterium]|jgi:7,8-dihydropterin-6-yl-methyl-4-(beta-D-ribofuranosyl)aminobenzene 5'-phosphate synthase
MYNGNAVYLCFFVCMLLSTFGNPPLSAGEPAENSITIVYNNVPGDTTVDLQVGGGFSAYIIFRQKRILFDVGGDASTLINNIRVLDLDLSNLDAVLISHNHWDHVYGLPGIYVFVESNPGVYVPHSAKDAIAQQYPRADVLPVEEPMQIVPNVWSTGAMAVDYRGIPFSEQALVLENNDGLYVVTGCAHPGIVEIVERVRRMFPEQAIALVAGGFHLVGKTDEQIRGISARLQELGVKRIAPSHCTGQSAMRIFEKEWGEQYLRLYLGNTYHF